jgi:hypothetical protein
MSEFVRGPYTTPATWRPHSNDLPLNEWDETDEEKTRYYSVQTDEGKAGLLASLLTQLFDLADYSIHLSLWYAAFDLFLAGPPEKFDDWKWDQIVQIDGDGTPHLQEFVEMLTRRLLGRFRFMKEQPYEELLTVVRNLYLMVFSAGMNRRGYEDWQDTLDHFVEVVNNCPLYCIESLVDEPVHPQNMELFEVSQIPTYSEKSVLCTVNVLGDVIRTPELKEFPLEFHFVEQEKLTEKYAAATPEGKANMLASLYVLLIGYDDKLLNFALWNAAYKKFLLRHSPTFTYWGPKEDLIDNTKHFVDNLTEITNKRFSVCFEQDRWSWSGCWEDFVYMTWSHYEMVFCAACQLCTLPLGERRPWFIQVVNTLRLYSFSDLVQPFSSRLVHSSDERSKYAAKPKKTKKGPKIVEVRDASPVRAKK